MITTSRILMLAVLLSLPAVAQEGKPPVKLKLRKDAKLVTTVADKLMKQYNPLITQYLTGTADQQKAARVKLIKQGPLSAIAIHARMPLVTDEKQKSKLTALSLTCRSDTWDNATVLFNCGHFLATVSKADKLWGRKELPSWRLIAKVVHHQYVKAEPYESGLKQSLTMTTPYKDLPAAADVFDLAAAMYHRIAKTTKDEKVKTKATEAAKKCEALAKTKRGSGARSK